MTVPTPPVNVTVLPLTDAGPESMAKLAGSPEEAVALTAKGASPNKWFAIGSKVSVCQVLLTNKSLETLAAA